MYIFVFIPSGWLSTQLSVDLGPRATYKHKHANINVFSSSHPRHVKPAHGYLSVALCVPPIYSLANCAGLCLGANSAWCSAQSLGPSLYGDAAQ